MLHISVAQVVDCVSQLPNLRRLYLPDLEDYDTQRNIQAQVRELGRDIEVEFDELDLGEP